MRMKRKISFADVYHSASRYAVGQNNILPCLLPRTLAWSFQRNRILTGQELLRCQGLSFEDEDVPEFSQSQLTSLAGNALLGNLFTVYI